MRTPPLLPTLATALCGGLATGTALAWLLLPAELIEPFVRQLRLVTFLSTPLALVGALAMVRGARVAVPDAPPVTRAELVDLLGALQRLQARAAAGTPPPG